MRIVRNILRGLMLCLSVPILYLLISLLLSYITIEPTSKEKEQNQTIYLNTNGVHLDIVIPIDEINQSLLSGLDFYPTDRYLSFGWGDENFYIYTPTWSDLSLNTAFRALFLKSSTLIHLTRYQGKQTDWVEVKLSETELERLNQYIQHSFQLDHNKNKIVLENQGYSSIDDFYKSNGSYSLFNTCNTWVNRAFKESGLKACFWTPFDFALMQKYP